MRIAFVQTYPIYHEGVDTAEWLSLCGRETGMAAWLARAGHDVEFWAVGENEEERELPEGAEPHFRLRVFPPHRRTGPTRGHFSIGLLERAERFDAHLYILNGIDGGAGVRLLRRPDLRGGRALVFILGGGHYSPDVPSADGVFYQSEEQRRWLERPGARFWRRAVAKERLVFLPRTVDTDLFHPGEGARREWDVVIACRLIDRIKNLDVLGPLSRRFAVAVAGDGPDGAKLRERFSRVTWLGRVPHRELPGIIRAGRIFMHTGIREIVPRVITEAMACGTPVVAFAGLVTPEVVPPGCGLRLPRRDFLDPLAALLGDEERRVAMGRAARAHAVDHLSPDRVEAPLEDMLRRLDR